MPPQHTAIFRSAWLIDLLLMTLLTILFGEWIRPLAELTDTHSLPLFLLFFVFILLIRWLSLPWYVYVLANFMVLMYIVHYLYFPGPFFRFTWLSDFGEQLSYSFILLIRWDLAQLPFEVKTLFFLLSIWYVGAYLYLSRLRRKSMFTFLLMTVIYLATLDTFTPYQATYGVVRIIIGGFLYLALLEYLHIKTKAWMGEHAQIVGQQKESFTSPFLWILSSVIMLSMAALVGVLSPKAEPQWPDPVAFLQSHSGMSINGDRGSTVQKVGYGENDEVLGGGFVQDDSIAFYAITTKQQYWRGESKDIYTGQGWEKSNPPELFFISPQKDPINLQGHPGQLLADGVDTEAAQAKVFFTERRFSTLFYQGDIKQVQVYPNDIYVQLEPISGRFTTWEDGVFSARKHVEEYVLESEYPTFSVRQLQETDPRHIPEHIHQRYTQLPEQLPDRIGELAQEITAGLGSQYERVREIENYFRRNGYRYETKDVPVPGPDQDYVDQFLFETKQGYCDNFSTAMVVMLRTIDIPARWVKGFTFGEIIEKNDGHFYTQVLNRNAHSWVEVYFPEIGWVPFEPTQSFHNPFSFERDLAQPDSSASEDKKDEQEKKEDEEKKEELEKQENQENKQEDKPNMLSPFNGALNGKTSGKIILWITAGCILLLSALYFRRYTILRWLIRRYKRRSKQMESNLRGYELLITYLGMLALKRKQTQTLREYVLELEHHLATDWAEFTRDYERLRYGRQNSGRKKDS